MAGDRPRVEGEYLKPSDANYPESKRRFMHRLSKSRIPLDYQTIKKICFALMAIGALLMIPIVIAIGLRLLVNVDVAPASWSTSYANSIESVLGDGVPGAMGLAGLLMAAIPFFVLISLSMLRDKTSCDRCDTDFCLQFERATYHTREKNEKQSRDKDGNLKDPKVTGYDHYGTLYTTCTTRNKEVKRKGYEWTKQK